MDTYIYLFIAIGLSAFFSGMEISFISVDKLRLEMSKNEGVTHKILSVFFKSPNNFISTMLVGNNISLVIYGILMSFVIKEYIILDYIQNEFGIMLIQTVISTIIILITGEFMPKALFKINPNKALTIFAIPLFVFYIILYPISKFTSMMAQLVLKIFRVKTNEVDTQRAFTKVDLDHFIQTGIDSVANEEEIENEVKIFQNALDFSNIKIRDCMIPRTEIVSVEFDSSIEELKNKFIESGISKLIVYKNDIDNVVGYIHSSEMFRRSDNWQDGIKQLPIVPETMAANKLMKAFMQQKRTIAVVVDEFGGTSGIVSLEDLVEEIFGDIEDEHDTNNYVCKQIGENEYILAARLEIEKVNETFDIQLPESDEYMTVGGLILNEYQSFPKVNEVIKIGKFSFRIIKVTSNKIELVKLKIIE